MLGETGEGGWRVSGGERKASPHAEKRKGASSSYINLECQCLMIDTLLFLTI